MFSLHQVQQMSEIDSEDRYRLLAMRCRHAAWHSLLSEVRLHQEKVYQGFCPESRLAGNGRIQGAIELRFLTMILAAI